MLATEQQVRSVPSPEATSTWFPFAHSLLLDRLEASRELAGIEIESTRYELSQEGLKMFGVWSFKGERGIQQSIGFRNSIDKSLSVGICAGTRVVVCSNLAFSGEWMQFRKHTKFAEKDLWLFVLEAFGMALQASLKEVEWQHHINTIPCPPEDWKVLTYTAIDHEIIPPSKITPFLEKGRENDLTLGDWFNVATNILSQRNLLYTEENFSMLRNLVYLGTEWC